MMVPGRWIVPSITISEAVLIAPRSSVRIARTVFCAVGIRIELRAFTRLVMTSCVAADVACPQEGSRWQSFSFPSLALCGGNGTWAARFLSSVPTMTCRFPASSSPTGFTARHSTWQLPHSLEGAMSSSLSLRRERLDVEAPISASRSKLNSSAASAPSVPFAPPFSVPA
jgi:hypothetical protein